jgi:quinoprotein glucose dehydrogenase
VPRNGPPRSPLPFLLLVIASAACGPESGVSVGGDVQEWIDYGGDRGGLRYSPLADVTPANVDRLEPVWTWHSGDVADGRSGVAATTAYELTPILVEGTLYACTPFNRVVALDPETGAERWSYDPGVDLAMHYANQLICRGVATWRDPGRSHGPCHRRIFTATNDARLIALDAATGRPCPDFGQSGQVDLTEGVGERRYAGEYQMTSPPAVLGDRVIVGSAVADNSRVNAPSGVVRAYDARSGALRWAWDPVPEGYTARYRSAAGYTLGTANVWAPIAVDEERDLVFLPTGNTSPDYYGGHRDAIETYASSVVALRGADGRPLWHFQTVHHDLWDYDVPAQPTLFPLRRDGAEIPALVQGTKMGHLFVLHRESGEPLFPVEERPVPQGGAPGEHLSPTQPFPVRPPPLTRTGLGPDDAWGITPWDRGACRERIASLRSDGIFTPPSQEGSVMYPGNAGGINWGGVAVDPQRQVLVANFMDVPWVVTLLPAADYEQERSAHPGVEISPQRGTPFAMRREVLLSPLGVPCNAPPWGRLAAVDLARGEILWQVPLGTIRDIAPIPLPIPLGVPNLGGPLITASGLVFIGAALDDYLRAFDLATGEELWRARLPAGGQATPMTYRAHPGGRQYVVIAAGGHSRAGSKLGDALVAFALPQ